MVPSRKSFARVFGAAGVAAVAMAAAPAGKSILLPLSERDFYTIKESGCEFSFGQGRSSLVSTINRQLLIRTAPGKAGLAQCTIPSAAMAAFHDKGGKVSCRGIALSIKRTGRQTSSIEADSSSWPAALTVRHVASKREQVLRGTAGVAC